jgi:hypothetical protein
MDLSKFSWRCISPGALLLVLREALRGDGLQARAVVFEVRYPDFEKHVRKSGFIHASDDAVMPMPGSIVDQIATLEFLYKNSSLVLNSWM